MGSSSVVNRLLASASKKFTPLFRPKRIELQKGVWDPIAENVFSNNEHYLNDCTHSSRADTLQRGIPWIARCSFDYRMHQTDPIVLYN